MPENEDWRTQLQPEARQRIVNRITEILKRHLPSSEQEEMLELENIAVMFEEQTYTDETSVDFYLTKIALTMLTMETEFHPPMENDRQQNLELAIRILGL